MYMYFRFILAPFFRWSISFPEILDFYKDSEGGSYFSSLAFKIHVQVYESCVNV